jgi:gliding motility-associated lipoprotein GldD
VGYFRIDLPEHSYKEKELDCSFSFKISDYSYLEIYNDSATNCWFNIAYPELDAKLHVTYRRINNDLRTLLEEAHGMAYEHQIKASRIKSRTIIKDSVGVYGLEYKLGGDVASPYQFYLTDSTEHFLRGSLYFRARPNPDSIRPSLDYVERDMEKFIESFEWEN